MDKTHHAEPSNEGHVGPTTTTLIPPRKSTPVMPLALVARLRGGVWRHATLFQQAARRASSCQWAPVVNVSRVRAKSLPLAALPSPPNAPSRLLAYPFNLYLSIWGGHSRAQKGRSARTRKARCRPLRSSAPCLARSRHVPFRLDFSTGKVWYALHMPGTRAHSPRRTDTHDLTQKTDDVPPMPRHPPRGKFSRPTRSARRPARPGAVRVSRLVKACALRPGLSGNRDPVRRAQARPSTTWARLRACAVIRAGTNALG